MHVYQFFRQSLWLSREKDTREYLNFSLKTTCPQNFSLDFEVLTQPVRKFYLPRIYGLDTWMKA